jgi:hypothetical protein
VTLGLFPNPRPRPTQTDVPSVGEFPNDVDPGAYAPPLPYEPADRLVGSDGYWAAKRMLSLSSTHIALAVAAGNFSDPRASRVLQAAIEARRAKVATYWFDRATPIELLSFAQGKILLRDEAVQAGLAPPNVTDYRIHFLTSDGDSAGEGFTLHPHGSVMVFTLPDMHARDYLVVQVTARRAGRLLPRNFELHLALGGERPMALGVRH